jgi:hypothetical protein
MRAVFAIFLTYLVLILAGIVVYSIVGATHH